MSDRHLIILVEESDSSVGFYDSLDGSVVARIEVGFWPHEIEISADKSTAYVTNFGVKDYDERMGRPGASVSVIDIVNKCEVDRFYTLTKERKYTAPHGVKLSPDGSKLYVNVEQGDKILVFDLEAEERSPVKVFALPEAPAETSALDSLPDNEFDVLKGTHNFIFSPEGDHLWVVSGRGGVTRMDPRTGESTGHFTCNGAVRGLAYTPDFQYLIASATNEICLVSPHDLQIHKRFSTLGVGQLLYSKPTPDGKYIIAPAVWESQILIIDIHTGQVHRRILTGVDPIHVAVAPNGRSAYVTHGRSLFVSEIDLEKFEIVRTIATKGGPNGIAIAPFSARPERERLRFGCCIPLSGPNAAEGRDLRLGYQYWQELVNKAGGIVIGGTPHEVDIAYEDTGSEVAEVTIRALTEKLVDQHQVEFLLGNYPSPPNEHSGRVAHERKIPFVTSSGAAERIYNQGFEYVFGIMSSAKAFLEGTLRAIINLDPKPRSIAFLSCEDPAALQDAKTTALIAQDMGLSLLYPEDSGLRVEKPGVIVFRHLEEDFQTYIEVVKSLAPDIFMNTGHLPESVSVVKQSKALQFEPLCLAFSVGPAFPSFSDQLGGAAEHMLGAAMWSAVQNNWGHDRFVRPQDFAREFFARFSQKAAYLAAGGMACGLVYEEAFRKARSRDPIKVRDALRQINIDTFYSHIEFDERGLNAKRPLITIQLRRVDGDMAHIPVWPLELAGEYKIVWPFPGWPSET